MRTLVATGRAGGGGECEWVAPMRGNGDGESGQRQRQVQLNIKKRIFMITTLYCCLWVLPPLSFDPEDCGFKSYSTDVNNLVWHPVLY